MFNGATPAIRRGSENPFVRRQIKTPNASPEAIELNPSCSEQFRSKRSSAGPRNKNMEYGCAFRYSVLHL